MASDWGGIRTNRESSVLTDIAKMKRPHILEGMWGLSYYSTQSELYGQTVIGGLPSHPRDR